MIKKLKIKNKKQKIKSVIFILAVLFLIIPFTVRASWFDDIFEDLENWISDEDNNNTQIINKIKVEANTGGNVIEGGSGEIIEGEEKTSVEIKTIINGEEIDPIDIESSASEVNVESRIEIGDDGKVSISREIEVGSPAQNPSDFQAGKEDKEIIKEKTEAVQNWWSDLVDNLKTLILGIFNIF